MWEKRISSWLIGSSHWFIPKSMSLTGKAFNLQMIFFLFNFIKFLNSRFWSFHNLGLDFTFWREFLKFTSEKTTSLIYAMSCKKVLLPSWNLSVGGRFKTSLQTGLVFIQGYYKLRSLIKLSIVVRGCVYARTADLKNTG